MAHLSTLCDLRDNVLAGLRDIEKAAERGGAAVHVAEHIRCAREQIQSDYQTVARHIDVLIEQGEH